MSRVLSLGTTDPSDYPEHMDKDYRIADKYIGQSILVELFKKYHQFLKDNCLCESYSIESVFKSNNRDTVTAITDYLSSMRASTMAKLLDVIFEDIVEDIESFSLMEKLKTFDATLIDCRLKEVNKLLLNLKNDQECIVSSNYFVFPNGNVSLKLKEGIYANLILSGNKRIVTYTGSASLLIK